MDQNNSSAEYRLNEEGGYFEEIVPGYHSLTAEELELKLEIQHQELIMNMRGIDTKNTHNEGNKYYLIADGNVIKYTLDEKMLRILDKTDWVWKQEDNLIDKIDIKNNKAMEWKSFKDIFENEKKNSIKI